MTEPTIIMCAPNGARRQKDDHSALPLSALELADCAEQVLRAGTSMLHLHVRGENGEHSLSVARYREAIAAIRARVGDALVIQVTSEAVGVYSRAEQIAMVRELRPEAVSLALRELCPDDGDIPSTKEFFLWMREEGVFPQVILYDEVDVARFECLRKEGVFACAKPFVLCVQGRGGEESPGLEEFTAPLTKNAIPWAACAFGEQENALATTAGRLGGHVRVGFENNLKLPDGSLAPSNAALVEHSRNLLQQLGLRIATADDVRRQFMVL